MTGLYTKLVSNFLFPLHERLKGHNSPAVRRSLEDTQWWDREQLQVLQLKRLQALVKNAFEQVPYYRAIMDDAEFTPQDIHTLGDFKRFPLLTKETIRTRAQELKARGATGLVPFSTGGSSGQPLVFYLGKERLSHDVAAKWRATRWWGLDVGDREIVVWGSPLELSSQDKLKEIRDRVLRTRLLPAFEMSEANQGRFLEEIRAYRPKMLFGYPSSLSLIARHARARDVRMDDLGISVAFVTSERLYKSQREIIEEVFACSVANGYGGRDAGFVAHECPEGRLHITAEDLFVEIVDDAGCAVKAGTSGEIVITHFATGEFPFIRYRTGDVGVLGEQACPCGRGLPVLAELQGRTTDFVVARDGTIMHGLALIYEVREVPGISAFKIVQEDLDHTRVELVLEPSFDSQRLAGIERGIQARLGADVRVALEIREKIEPDPSGKFRYVVSKVRVS